MNIFRKILVNILRSTASRYYQGARLTKAKAPDNPLALFEEWFSLATEVDPEWGSSVTLSTATSTAKPSNRLVLLKGYDNNGFVFFTNYNSRKAQELEENPNASMVFWWKETCRQIRIEGTVTRVSARESDEYFATRPRGSKLGAWASKQSHTLPQRYDLEKRVAELDKKYKDKLVPRPPFWGGYQLTPTVIEFWQGRVDRLHDRLRYNQEAGKWSIQRLSP